METSGGKSKNVNEETTTRIDNHNCYSSVANPQSERLCHNLDMSSIDRLLVEECLETGVYK